MSNYYNISEQEMRAFLTPLGFQPIQLPSTKELVFGKRLNHKLPLTLRVYTGINPDGHSRGVGEDAIRVNLFWRNQLGEIKKAGGSKRVHRVTNWQKNLKNRLDNWDQDFVTCHCGAPMVERENKAKGTKFLGCCNYPICKGAKPLPNTEEIRREIHKNTPIAFNGLTKEEMAAEQEVLRLESLCS